MQKSTIKADWFDLDGQQITNGQYPPLTKSIYRAAIDAAKMFGGTVGIANHHGKWIVVSVGNKRLVIGNG